jgi:hypothetical protein
MSFLGLYRDPTVAEVTSRCDWRIADLIAAEHPVSLYLVVPPSDISRTKPLIRLILNQIGRRLTESLDGSDGIERRHKLLLMLDEFPALGASTSSRRRWPSWRATASAASHRAVAQPDRQGVRAEPFDSRQLPCPRDVRHQRRTHGQADLRNAGHRHRAARAAQLRGPPARAVAGAPDGVAPGDRAPAADAGRSDAASA